MAHTILVVEDDADMRSLIAATLQTSGYAPISAASAEDGLALLETGRCHAALLDLRFPGASGLDPLGAIAAKWPAFPVIVTTASVEVREAQVRACGARGFLRKPFSAGQLLATIAGVLEPAGAPFDELRTRPS
jgi:DNA-binding NtrC family response regulator